MFSFNQTRYERLTTSPEPLPPGRHHKAHAPWYRLLSTRVSSKRARRNLVILALSFVALVVTVVLAFYGPLLYRILDLPSYRRYREAENSRRPATLHLSKDAASSEKDSVKYFFPEKRLIGASFLYLQTPCEYVVDGSRPLGAGWGNIVQEQILNVILAYAANRSYVSRLVASQELRVHVGFPS